MTNPNDFEGAPTIPNTKIYNLHLKKNLYFPIDLLIIFTSCTDFQTHLFFRKLLLKKRKSTRGKRPSVCEKLFNENSAIQAGFRRNINRWLWQVISRLVALISGIWHKWKLPIQQQEKSRPRQGMGNQALRTNWATGLQAGISDCIFSVSCVWVTNPPFFPLRSLVWRHFCSHYLDWWLQFHHSGQ